MKQVIKRIGSLLLSVCMVLTMLPTVALAEEGIQDSGAPSSTSKITAFADLAEDVSLQEVESGTSEDELNLPDTLSATVTTRSAITVTESVYSPATDSEAQEEETAVSVSGWISEPGYNPNYGEEGANTYTFKPTLDLPEGVTLADGVIPPVIKVTVNAPVALKSLPRGTSTDTISLVSAIQAAGLTATVSGNTVTVTGEVKDASSQLILGIDSGVTVVWNADYTNKNDSVPVWIKGTGTFRIIGGTVNTKESAECAIYVYESPLIIIDSASESTFTNNKISIYLASNADGRLVYLSGNVDYIAKTVKSDVIAYYSEETLKDKFSTISWTEGSNLFPLNNVVLTKSDGNAYNYQSGTAFTGAVTAALPDVLDLSSATITPSGSTTPDCTVTVNNDKSVSYSGTLNADDLMLTVSGAKVGDVAIGTFTTPKFGVNITPFVSVTDIPDVPATMEIGEALQLPDTVKPNNATKQDIVWSIKDAGITNAAITGRTLSATHTGTVTVTAIVTDGITYGTDYTKNFDIEVTALLSITPESCTFGPLEEGYGIYDYLDDAEPKTITVTNTGKTTLTGLKIDMVDENGDWYTDDKSSWPSSLALNASAQITFTPDTGLSSGTYRSTLKISTDQGVEASVPISLTVTKRKPRLEFGGTDVHKLDADFSGTGYSWNAEIKTLTLTSDYAAGQIESLSCDAETMTLKLAGDVTIDEHETSEAECIFSSGNLMIDLGGHTLTLMTGGDNVSALDGDILTIQNGTLVALLIGSDTADETPSIDAGLLTVGNAAVTADADSLNYGGINIGRSLTLNQGAKLRTCGAVGLDFDTANLLNLESDDISLTVIGGTSAIDLDTDLKYPAGSELRSWTNTDVTPPSPAGAGALLSSMIQEEWQMLWATSKYVQIGTRIPEAVITGISVRSNPGKLTYTEGDKLDLSGLTATLTYSDATTKEVSYTVFPANDITMTYADGSTVAQGDTLSTTQNGKAIVLTMGSYTAQTNALTVKAIPKYSVTVTNGTGSGKYAKGASVTIAADAAPEGKQFKQWTVAPSDVSFTEGSASTPTARFTMPANAVEITATYEVLPANTYSITVQNDGNGTANANVNSAAQGTEITMTATPNSRYRFKEWQVINGGMTINGNKFTMPAKNVTVKAIFEAIPVTNYTVTFNLNGGTRTGGGELTQTVVSGDSATAPTVTRSGYTFKGWDKAFTNVTSDLTVTATWRHKGGSSSSSGSSSRRNSTKITIITENQPNQPVTAVASVTATAGTNGTASVSIPDKAITDAITKAKAEAKKQDKIANGISVGLNVTMPQGTTMLTATLSQNALNSLVSPGVTHLTINGSPVTVTFDQKALAEIQKQSSGNVNITIAPQASLSETAKRMIGSRPVYNITVGYGNNSTVSSFGGGIATVAIPYTPANDEAIGGLYAVYVDEKGNATRVAGSAYDANSGCVIFTTTHFSMYGVGYTAPNVKFTDIRTHWAKESIEYVAARGVLCGTSETTFAPDTAMTRGMLVTALGRLAGVDVSSFTTSSFTDVKAGSTFQSYIEWAYQKDIVHGIGNKQFAPDRAITREEIAAIFANFAKATGYTLPVSREATTYADASSIGSTYKTAVTAMQQAGIMTGGTSNKFNPKSNATRAEVSSMLHRYIKLAIPSDTTAQ